MHEQANQHERHNPRGPHFLAKAPKIHLEITRGQARRKMRPVEVPVFMIGRADDCDLVLGDPRMPDAHTYLIMNETGVAVRHLGIEPVLTVDGDIVNSMQLQDGNRLGIGPYEFLVHIEHRTSNDGRSIRIEPAHEKFSAAETGVSLVKELIRDVRNEMFIQ